MTAGVGGAAVAGVVTAAAVLGLKKAAPVLKLLG